jgi:DNA replication and repair protein RecF
VLVTAGAGPATSVGHLWLTDFRCLRDVDVEFAPGLTVLQGSNGQGKTSVLEAVGWIARTRSFRRVTDAMLVRAGAEQAIIRAEVATAGRDQLFEAEIRTSGRNRVLCNRQPVARARDLHGLLRVTIFAPDDLTLVKGGPAERREYLDEILSMLAARYDAARGDFERVLKQRNALLRGGVRDEEARATLDVFDDQLVRSGAELVRGRLRLIERLVPAVAGAYEDLAHDARPIGATYECEYAGTPLTAGDAEPGAVEVRLRMALEQRRRAELERGITLVGPHRDELRLTIDGLDARYQASQGEQRTLALALRLAGHLVVRELVGAAPVLLLDDVFSELDAKRAAALVHNLPAGQTLLTTASELPPDVVAQRTLTVRAGRIETT